MNAVAILIGVSLLSGLTIGVTALIAAKLGLCEPFVIEVGRISWIVGPLSFLRRDSEGGSKFAEIILGQPKVSTSSAAIIVIVLLPWGTSPNAPQVSAIQNYAVNTNSALLADVSQAPAIMLIAPRAL